MTSTPSSWALVNLLPAFYELSSGRITIDGVDLRQVRLESLREQISIVSQEPFLFYGTIRENILYGRLDATDAEMIAKGLLISCVTARPSLTRNPISIASLLSVRGT